MNIRHWVAFVAAALLLVIHDPTASQRVTPGHDLYVGDFNGDGLADVLYLAREPGGESGIALRDTRGGLYAWQSWSDRYLGISWSAEAVHPVVADFDGDGRSDLFLQAMTAGNSQLLFADSDGKFNGVQQAIRDGYHELAWAWDRHRAIAGDFNGDGRADLFLQAATPSDHSFVVLSDAGGTLSQRPAQSWANEYLGFSWSAHSSAAYTGDFNGDGYADLLVRANPDQGARRQAGVGSTNAYNGVVYARPANNSGEIFHFGDQQLWRDKEFGLDWAADVRIATRDFDADGRADIAVVQPGNALSAALLNGRATGAAFANAIEWTPTAEQWTYLDPYRAYDESAIVGRLAPSQDLSALRDGASTLSSETSVDQLSPANVRAESSQSQSSMVTPLVSQIVAPKEPQATPNPPVAQLENSESQQGGAAAALAAAPTGTAAGRTPGTFAVSSTGAAVYNIPLWMPPGVGAVQLQLGLAYNSRGPNGTLGTGWSLTGLSTIGRCNKTFAQDASPGPVTNSLSDRFCLDGQQLKLVSGQYYGASGSVYATEIESFAKIVASGTVGNGPQSFTVTTKNGLIYEYGFTPDSRILAGTSGTVRTWALSGVRDRSGGATGNRIDIAYTNDAANGSYRVDSIKYPKTVTNQGPFYEVLFGYSDRPTTDVIAGYKAGFLTRETKKLDTITIQNVGGATAIKTYYLSYNQSTTTNRLRLSSVQECSAAACFPSTNIGYQNGQQSWSSTLSSASDAYTPSTAVGPMVADMNGDGLSDIVYPKTVTSSTSRWWVVLATQAGYAAPVDTGVVTNNTSERLVGAFSGSGKTQLLMQQSGFWYLLTYNGTAFTFTNTSLAVNGEFSAIDYDGDGLPDLASIVGSDIKMRRNVTAPGGAVTFASTTQTIWTKTGDWQISTGSVTLRSTADFDGDGRADLSVGTYVDTGFGVFVYWNVLRSNGFGSLASATPVFGAGSARPLVGDWNNDGCSDLLSATKVFVSDCAGAFSILTVPSVSGALLAADWDGDGRVDLLYANTTTNTWYVLRSTGAGIAAAVSTGIAAPTSTAWFVLDQDGDGLDDLGYINYAVSGLNPIPLKYRRHAGSVLPADLATSFTDAFGINQSPTYTSITRNNYSKYSDATLPEQDYQGPLYVVDQFTASTGVGDNYQNQLWYFGARVHLQGRGFLGFLGQRIYDTRSSLYTYQYFQRSFPYTGLLYQQATTQADGTTRISDSSSTVSQQTTGGTGTEARIFPFISGVTENRYEFPSGTLITLSTTSFTFGDGYGNPTEIVRSVTDKDPNSPLLPSNSMWKSTVTNAFENNPANNCFGLPKTTSVKSEVPLQTTATRSYAFEVDVTKCRIWQQTIEPSVAPSPLEVTTTLGFDTCGNVNSIQVVGSKPDGAAMDPRTTAMDYGTRCQLPEKMTNALLQDTRFTYRYDFGVPTEAKDPNLLVTSFDYDDFGRRTLVTRPDLTSTFTTFTGCSAPPCWGVPDLRFLVLETENDAGGLGYRQRALFYDGLDRLRYDEYHQGLGTWTNEIFFYDSLGRQTTQYRPFSSSYNGYTVNGYDAVNRVTSSRLYRGDGTLDRTTTIAYSGRKTTVTNPLSNATSQIHDVYGLLRQVIDPSPGGTTAYDYDAFGNLNRIQDPIGKVSSGTYNLRGFRSQWADADRGTWIFAANSLNEALSWTDAKNQAFSAQYDPLGRLTKRVEPDGESNWTWGTSAANKNIGRLTSVTGVGALAGLGETLSYDSVGRLSQRKITTDQAYFYDFTYNAIGAIDTITYPTSPVPTGQSGTRFKVKYEYSSGVAYKITNVTDSAATLWQLTKANDYGSAKEETFGAGANVVTTKSGYKDWTNELTSLQSGVPGSDNNRQNLSYDWDTGGRLTQRQDLLHGLTEVFQHDALDRVTKSTVSGVPTPVDIGYNAAGDITSKTGLGTYTYGDPNHPHAVTAAGGETRTYDANGNVLTINGQTQTWASFNLPTLLKSSVTAQGQLSYGPEHQRWKQVATDASGTETTFYVGGLLEKVTRLGVTAWRHYVPTPSGHAILVSRNSDSTGATTFALTDHIGSSDTLLSDTGATRANLSFDAFGARRGADWKATTSPDWPNIGSTTRRGFTFHEHLDAVGLIHMNGRVYDPKLGRFMSIDPLIGDLGDSQSVNPYAYVGNRPLRFTDPSGFDAVYPCNFVCNTIINTVVGWLFGSNSPPPPPPATVLPGQSAQNGVGMCGPGNTSTSCSGLLVYADNVGVGLQTNPSSQTPDSPSSSSPEPSKAVALPAPSGTGSIWIIIRHENNGEGDWYIYEAPFGWGFEPADYDPLNPDPGVAFERVVGQWLVPLLENENAASELSINSVTGKVIISRRPDTGRPGAPDAGEARRDPSPSTPSRVSESPSEEPSGVGKSQPFDPSQRPPFDPSQIPVPLPIETDIKE